MWPAAPGNRRQSSQQGQRGHHFIHAAAVKVRPAAGTGKEGIPAEQGVAAQQRDAALGMARGMEYLKLQGAHGQAVAVAIEIHAAERGMGQLVFQREQLGLGLSKSASWI